MLPSPLQVAPYYTLQSVSKLHEALLAAAHTPMPPICTEAGEAQRSARSVHPSVHLSLIHARPATYCLFACLLAAASIALERVHAALATRVCAATYKNQASSRGHVFVRLEVAHSKPCRDVHVSTTKVAEVCRCVLHIVDLAGEASRTCTGQGCRAAWRVCPPCVQRAAA